MTILAKGENEKQVKTKGAHNDSHFANPRLVLEEEEQHGELGIQVCSRTKQLFDYVVVLHALLRRDWHGRKIVHA